MTRTIAIIPKLKAPELNRIREAAPGWTVLAGGEATDDAVRNAEIVVGWRDGLESVVLSESSRVRWLQSWSAGMDHLEIDRYLERGIELTSANGVHAYPISETVFAMLLAFTRKIDAYIRNQQHRKWDHAGLKSEMHGKTIGIVGVGAIGEETARIAKAAFGMRVLGVRRSGAPSPAVDEMFAVERLLDMLPACDYVVAVVPSTSESKHLFDARAFAAMKETAYFVNVGRGSVVDTEALIDALNAGRIAGAGLDVFEEEPLPADHPLWAMNNVIVTPHTAGSTERYAERAVDIFLSNLEMVLNGRPPAINRLGAQGKRY
ncbi:D-2-hydroxyacid dehydrogenase [Paenibacillus antri]|uniref:D-2-hydroxyacid dehydrogenase n=1 Tax=Paenibacillus antri TaxID=2582848 RepID=A0A5R9G1R1_9BACL|nr:D-2-hydroxyacid dehydrogenase [Paenibacillus antri]TLS50277.1 D-2-hydroxyacid dehydrogenase [Paenibacillus antri]